MTEDLISLSIQGLHSAYLDESQKFVIALQQGATSDELIAIRQKMKLILEAIERREIEEKK